MMVTRVQVLAWLNALQKTFQESSELLTELDSDIGDADHGTNMDRGFTEVKVQLVAGAPADIRGILQRVALILIRTIGGASGPLYGSFFLEASKAIPAGDTEMDVLTFLEAGVEGVRQRGKAGKRDKTMLDALMPALDAMRIQGLDAAVQAAQTGVQATIFMQARKGRASYLGPRSKGHQDPGATSAYLMIRTAAEIWRE
jgi:dihydroxyacetone kinase-like protein